MLLGVNIYIWNILCNIHSIFSDKKRMKRTYSILDLSHSNIFRYITFLHQNNDQCVFWRNFLFPQRLPATYLFFSNDSHTCSIFCECRTLICVRVSENRTNRLVIEEKPYNMTRRAIKQFYVKILEYTSNIMQCSVKRWFGFCAVSTMIFISSFIQPT